MISRNLFSLIIITTVFFITGCNSNIQKPSTPKKSQGWANLSYLEDKYLCKSYLSGFLTKNERPFYEKEVAARGLGDCKQFSNLSDDEIEPEKKSETKPVVINDKLRTLLNGTYRLPNWRWTWGANLRDSKSFYDQQLWEDLALLVMEKGYEEDLTYYYLGRAAESLGEIDAARIYYKLSKAQRSKCAGVINNCTDINVPQAVSIRLAGLPLEIPKTQSNTALEPNYSSSTSETNYSSLVEKTAAEKSNCLGFASLKRQDKDESTYYVDCDDGRLVTVLCVDSICRVTKVFNSKTSNVAQPVRQEPTSKVSKSELGVQSQYQKPKTSSYSELKDYLERAINGTSLGAYWCKKWGVLRSDLFSPRSYKILDKPSDDQRNFNSYKVRIESSNKGGQPIIVTWSISMDYGQFLFNENHVGWCIASIKN